MIAVAGLRLFDFTRPSEQAAAADPLRAFSVLWAVAMIMGAASGYNDFSLRYGVVPMLLTTGMLATGLVVLLRPGSRVWLAALAAITLARYAAHMPVSSNNQTIAAFMNLAILIVLARPQGDTHEQLRQVARGLLATMYFFGIFHKINTGFLDPVYSCATSLYRPLMSPFGLEDWSFGIWSGIFGTFIVEAIALVALYWRRIFWLGLLVSLPFHYVIPLSGFAYYQDFSSLVFALYSLCLPRDAAAVAGASMNRAATAIGRPLAAWLPAPFSTLAMGVAGFLLILAALSVAAPGQSLHHVWWSGFNLMWALWGGAIMLIIINAALAAMPYRPAPPASATPWWLHGLPLLLFLSCWSPYVGLKTESSIAMFSNLHTEGGVSNHLIMPAGPYPFPYQDRLMQVTHVSDPRLAANFRDRWVVEHTVAMALRRNPNVTIDYVAGGRRYTGISWANWPHSRPNWLERTFLAFKPVYFTRPKPCTH